VFILPKSFCQEGEKMMRSLTKNLRAITKIAGPIIIVLALSGYSYGAASDDVVGWGFGYDDQDRLTTLKDPAGRITRFDYIQDGKGKVTSVKKKLPAGTEVLQGLDRFGRLSSVKDSMGISQFTYDGFGRLSMVQRSGYPAVKFNHDTADRLTQIEVEKIGSIEYEYDFLGRFRFVKTPAGKIEYRYFPGKGSVERILPNGVWTRYEYQPDGKLQSIMHVGKDNKQLAKFTYAYRPDGLISERSEWRSSGERKISYQYDEVGRLLRVNDSKGNSTQYEYDKFGNRIGLSEAGRTLKGSYDWAGRILNYGDEEFKRDAVGNVSQRRSKNGPATEYVYDDENLLSSVKKAGEKIQYRYDGNGQLIERTSAGITTRYVPMPFSDVWKPLAATGAVSKNGLYIWVEGVVGCITGRGAEYYLEDHAGSVCLVVDENGKIIEEPEYSPFGEYARDQQGLLPRPGFAGMFYDPHARLYLTRARAYDPLLGRFLQADPAKRVPGTNQEDLMAYSYCGEDPINLKDLTGGHAQRTQRFTFVPFSLTGVYPFATEIADKPLVWDPYADDPAWDSDPEALVFESDDDEVIEALLLGVNVRSMTSLAWWLAGPRISITSFTASRMPAPSRNFRPRTPRPHVRPAQTPRTTPRMPNYRPTAYHHPRTLPAPPNHRVPHPMVAPRMTAEQRARHFGPGSTSSIRPGEAPKPPQGFVRPRMTAEQRTRYFGSNRGNQAGPGRVGGVYLGGAGKALEGLDSLRGVALDGENGRLVLLGEDSDKKIGLPPLRLDDVVAIFRCAYDHGTAPFVSIDPRPEQPKGDIMLTRFGPEMANTYAGWVLFETDRVMKAFGLGKDNVTGAIIKSGIPDYKQMLRIKFGLDGADDQKEEVWHRWWILPSHVTKRYAAAGQLTLLDVPLKVNTERMELKDGKLVTAQDKTASRGAEAFSQWFTRHYDDLAKEVVSPDPRVAGKNSGVRIYSELQRIALITAIAEQLRDQGVPMPQWMREYKIQPCPTPATTPALVVKNTATEQRGSRTWTRTAQFYGGVNLAPADADVRTIPEDKSAANVAIEVAKALPVSPEPKPVTFRAEQKEYRATALPGAETVDVGPCRMVNEDLTVSVADSDTISLARSYSSFFAPDGELGLSWTIDMPRLIEQRRPKKRGGDGERIEFALSYQLTTPLGTVDAVFRNFRDVRDFNGKFLVPENNPDILCIAGSNEAIAKGAERQVIFKNGQRWHFDKQGYLVAQARKPFMAVYIRDERHRVTKMEGWYGEKLKADISLEYDRNDRIVKATGSDKKVISYSYDEKGHLLAVKGPLQEDRYAYKDSLVIMAAGRSKVRNFVYDERGRLLQETDEKGQPLVVQEISRDSNGATVVLKEGHSKDSSAAQTKFVYDKKFRPVQAAYSDGSKASWSYGSYDSMLLVRQNSDGDEYRIETKSKGKDVEVKIPEGGVYDIKDQGEGVTSLNIGQKTAIAVKRSVDGLVRSLQTEGAEIRFGYTEQGLVNFMQILSAGQKPGSAGWAEAKFDQTGRLIETKDSTGNKAEIVYGSGGSPDVFKTERAKITVQRNQTGSPIEVSTSWGTQQTNRYDKTGELLESTLKSAGNVATVTFVPEGPSKVRGFEGEITTCSYYSDGDQKGRIKNIQTPNGLSLDYSYEKDRLAAVECGKRYRWAYKYDAKGRVTELAMEKVR
jgi:RHS repeat-associated protein